MPKKKRRNQEKGKELVHNTIYTERYGNKNSIETMIVIQRDWDIMSQIIDRLYGGIRAEMQRNKQRQLCRDRKGIIKTGSRWRVIKACTKDRQHKCRSCCVVSSHLQLYSRESVWICLIGVFLEHFYSKFDVHIDVSQSLIHI